MAEEMRTAFLHLDGKLHAKSYELVSSPTLVMRCGLQIDLAMAEAGRTVGALSFSDGWCPKCYEHVRPNQPIDEPAERLLFEDWANEQEICLDEDFFGAVYLAPGVEMAWQSWLASARQKREEVRGR